MPDVDLPFSRDEYAERLHGARQAMDRAGVEVLFTCDPSNMAWLTGYDGWSFYVHQGCAGRPGRGAGVLGPRHGRQGRDAHLLHGGGEHRQLSRSLRDVRGPPPDGPSGRSHPRARMGEDDARRRDGELLLLGQGARRAVGRPQRRDPGRDRARQLAAGRRNRKPNSATCAGQPASWSGCTRAPSS